MEGLLDRAELAKGDERAGILEEFRGLLVGAPDGLDREGSPENLLQRVSAMISVFAFTIIMVSFCIKIGLSYKERLSSSRQHSSSMLTN